MSFYGYNTFRVAASYGDVIIMIRPKKGLVRMYDAGNEGDAILRNLLRENKWQIKSLALSVPPTDTTYPKNVYLIRGENLLNYLKEPDTHNDSVLDLLTKDEQEAIKKQRASHAADDRAQQPFRQVNRKAFASGVLPYCMTTDRFLFGVRGPKVSGAGLVAMFGGLTEAGETAPAGAARELKEEAGLEVSPDKLIPLWRYEDDELVYHSFLLPVNSEIEPDLNTEEMVGSMWLSYREFAQTNMHPGVIKLFENDATLQRVGTSGNRPVPKYTQLVEALMAADDGPLSGEDPDDDPPPKRAA